jgi:polar amino acid transport system substrate-binding protein
MRPPRAGESYETQNLLKLAVLFAAVAISPAHADALADLSKAGVIKVAVPQDFPPFG